MKVLIASEESQTVCKAFREKGHEAYYCDLLPTSGNYPEWHIQGDVIEILNGNKVFSTQNGEVHSISGSWDIIIAFPPCDHLAVSGAKHFEQKRKDGRQQDAINFFMMIANGNCSKIAIENPIGIMSTVWRKPTQIVQPYYFGDPFTKTTCLWLKGLPRLNATNIVDKGKRHVTKSGKSLPEWYNMPPGPDRKRIRSKTFPGLSSAMADQWG